MQRAYGGNVQGSAPAMPGSLQVGYPKDSGGSTTPGYWWFHMVTESLMNLLSAAGLTASASDMTQITQAVVAISKANSVTGAMKPVRVIDTTTSVTYSGAQTVDGVTLISGDRVLRNSSSSPATNGIYIVNTGGPWARASDMAPGATVPEATMISVSEGSSANLGSIWTVNAVSGEVVTVGTTAFNFTNITASTQAMFASYLTIATAASTYLTQTNASSTYQTIAGMSSYVTLATGDGRYLKIVDAQASYDTIAARNSALSSYLTTSSASSTYATIGSLSSYVTTSTANASYVTYSYLNNAQINSLGVGTPASGSAGEIRATGIITGSYSDDRLKQVEADLSGEDAMTFVKAARVFFYRPNAYAQSLGVKNMRELGMSAQQFEEFGFPEVVAEAGLQDPNADPAQPKLKTLRYERGVPILTKAVDHLDDKVIDLEAKLKSRDEDFIKLQAEVERLIASHRRAPGTLGTGR